MQKLRRTYRGIISWLRSNEEARLLLGLYRIPVHTTIIRFAKKIGKFIHLILNIRRAKTVAVDATGFELEAKSFYYRTLRISDMKQRAKRYMKLSIAVDADKQLILTYRIRRKLRHDNIDFKSLLKELDIDYVVADKGYSSKNNRDFVLYKLNAIPVIPAKISEGAYFCFNGKYKLRFDKQIYHQRSKVETVFSVIKRRYGSVLRGKSYATQRVELISKLIAYNLDRKLNYLILLIRGLHQSPIFNLHKNRHFLLYFVAWVYVDYILSTNNRKTFKH